MPKIRAANAISGDDSQTTNAKRLPITNGRQPKNNKGASKLKTSEIISKLIYIYK